MSIVLFAIIGAQIKANAWYWIFFGLYCFSYVVRAFAETIKEKL